MIGAETMDAVERLLSEPPYAVAADVKRSLLLAALNEAYQHHFRSCPAYRRYCERRGFDEVSVFNDAADLPFVSVQAFKENASLLRSVDPKLITTRLSSSATSGVASSVDIDKITAKRQVRALASVIGAVLGPRRRPFLVLDIDPRTAGGAGLGARSAAVRGFLNLAREANYFMEATQGGALRLKDEEFAHFLERYSVGQEPVVVFGFTFVLFAYAVQPMLKSGRQFRLPPGSHIVHIGGWKKLADQQVSKAEFNETMAAVFGVPASNVVDFYGFTEQMGVTYPDAPDGAKCAPAFSEVVVRDPSTLTPVADGQIGLLEFVTPIPYSYPGIAVLTDDIGMVTSRDCRKGGWLGTRFQILGRAKKAEARGCGDIMGEKVLRPAVVGNAAAVRKESSPRLLFGNGINYAQGGLFAPIDISTLPAVGDLTALGRQLREARQVLDSYSADELIAIVSAAAARWASPASPLVPLRQQGLLFLTGWCQSANLRLIADRSLRGRRGFMDGFQALAGTNRRLMRAQPRGLVAHWLAGNVPLLSMLVLVQALVTRNANLLKAASSFSRVLPTLLDAFRGLTVTGPTGRILHGDDVLKTIAVVYFGRDDRSSAEQLSSVADVRLAWGGREAIESILNLPKRFGTEDVIFGPKLSFMVIGRESLATARTLRKAARNAATDASVFDQYACASPHTIFVERGGALSPRDFAAELASEMEKALIRIPKGPVDAGTAGNIERLRLRYEFTGELWCSKGTEWTVLFDEKEEHGLAEACYSRVITVRAVDDVLKTADFVHHGIQTIGLSFQGERKLAFADAASARGAERFPDLGRMTYFDAPWDGLFAMDRFVRWVTLGGPF